MKHQSLQILQKFNARKMTFIQQLHKVSCHKNYNKVITSLLFGTFHIMFSSLFFCLCEQSEEDKTLQEELTMLVERLQVSPFTQNTVQSVHHVHVADN